MKNYTLTHTSKTSLISVKITKGGFTDGIQYEFDQILSDSDIDKVYESLSDYQKRTLTHNKNTFKQFVRAIKIRYPVTNDVKKEKAIMSNLVREEKVYIASRLSKHIGITSDGSTKATIGYGTIDDKKFKRQVEKNTNGKLIEEEKIIYWENNGFILAVKTEPSYQTESKRDMYIYVTLLVS